MVFNYIHIFNKYQIGTYFLEADEQLVDVKFDKDEWRQQAGQLMLISTPLPTDTQRKKFLGIF